MKEDAAERDGCRERMGRLPQSDAADGWGLVRAGIIDELGPSQRQYVYDALELRPHDGAATARVHRDATWTGRHVPFALDRAHRACGECVVGDDIVDAVATDEKALRLRVVSGRTWKQAFLVVMARVAAHGSGEARLRDLERREEQVAA
jgi:hypothetical protein